MAPLKQNPPVPHPNILVFAIVYVWLIKNCLHILEIVLEDVDLDALFLKIRVQWDAYVAYRHKLFYIDAASTEEIVNLVYSIVFVSTIIYCLFKMFIIAYVRFRTPFLFVIIDLTYILLIIRLDMQIQDMIPIRLHLLLISFVPLILRLHNTYFLPNKRTIDPHIAANSKSTEKKNENATI